MRGLDLRAHFEKWLDDAGHRSPRERFISEQLAGKRLAGENAAQHAHGRAGVSAIERLRRSLQLRAYSADFNRSAAYRSIANLPITVFALEWLPLAAEFCHAIEGAGAVARRGKILEAARALGNRRQHRVPMRDGFVSGNANDAAHLAGGTNDDIRTVLL